MQYISDSDLNFLSNVCIRSLAVYLCPKNIIELLLPLKPPALLCDRMPFLVLTGLIPAFFVQF